MRNMSHSPPVKTVSGAPERVDGHALIQLQHARPVIALDHLHVLITGLGLVEQPRGRLDRADRDQRGGRRRRRSRAATGARGAAPRRVRGGLLPPSIVRCVPRSGIVTSAEHERADDAPDRREGVEAPGDRPRVLDVRDREPDREWRDRPEQRHRDRRRARARRKTTRRRHRPMATSRPLTARSRIGRAMNGVAAIMAAAATTIKAQQPRLGPAVSELPAEPVADRQVDAG